MIGIGSYYIVNDFDRPSEGMIAELLRDGLWYLAADKRKRFPAMSISKATPVEDFGIVLEERDSLTSSTGLAGSQGN